MALSMTVAAGCGQKAGNETTAQETAESTAADTAAADTAPADSTVEDHGRRYNRSGWGSK